MDPELILELSNACLKMVVDQYNNNCTSFYSWLSISSDYDFMYIYECMFKKHYPELYKCETSIILSYYAVNLAHAIISFYEIEYSDFLKLSIFIKNFINYQFKNMDIDQLYLS